MKSKGIYWGVNTLLVAVAASTIAASLLGLSPQGTYDAHDPSRIAFNKGLYFYFSTGDKIRMHFSADMIHWNVGPSPLPNGIPAWAKAKVPANGGDTVWAPDLIYNPTTRLWTLFYSYSSWGSQTSVIGALTSPDLKTDSLWTDAGLVIASDGTKDYNCIDPAPIFVDGKDPAIYMTFGSYWTGIKGIRLDAKTLQPASPVTALAGASSGTDMEASFLWPQGGYYYLFYTQGTCCQGVNSTYHVMYGRSKSPLGPFVDKNGVSLLSGGGSPFFSKSGTMIGPGHIGIAYLDNILRASFHYYDGAADGSPKLGIQSLQFGSDGWLAMGSDLADGTYSIVSKQNGLSLGVSGESDAEDTPVDQWNWLNRSYQKWVVKRQVDGTYAIQCLANGKAMAVYGGYDSPGVNVLMKTWSGNDAQRWIIDQTNDGYYRLRTVTGTVLDVPGFSTTLGTHMWTYTWLNGTNQKWRFIKQ